MSTSSANQGTKQVHCGDHAGVVLERLRAHYESQQLFDVVLIGGVDKKSVPAHRLMLSACSPYFSAMFTGSLREATDKEVTLNEVQGDILQSLVSFCYSGRIELRQDTAETLLMSASLLQIDSVVAECSKYLAEQLDPSNCLGMLTLAERHNCKELHEKAKEYTLEEFIEVSKNEEFFLLSATQLAELIANDDLIVPSEQDVFNSVMEWVNYSGLTNRKSHLRQLLPLVRMTQLSPSFIDDHVEAICRSNNCEDMLITAFKWHSLPEKREKMATKYTKPRTAPRTLLAFGTCDTDETIQVECYCACADKWSVWKSAISYRKNFSVASMKDNLLILGGQNTSFETLNSVVSMNVATLALTHLQPMDAPRSGLCVAVVENFLYAIGGEDDSGVLNAVERWDPVEDTWSYVAPMTTRRWSAGAAVLNDCIYAAGGYDGVETLRTVEYYNPRLTTWTECAPMYMTRRGFGVAASNGFLYAVGGRTNGHYLTSSAERYDPVTDKWTMIESMSVARAGFTCGFLGKSLMAVGGNPSSEVEEYDPEAKKWNKKGALTRKYDRVAVCFTSKSYMKNFAKT